MPDPPWWRDAVGYEVYLRSFADGDGDGVGDLLGLHDRLPHLSALGIDVIWITPCYPSPGHDHGYDVADHLDVDGTFGGLDALEQVVTTAHDHGLRVILDLVPNHTSHQHPWFREAVADPASPRRNYYVWADGPGPPNNWRSNFGGPAWTRDPASGQWYLHLFLPQQPDLDWRNPAVRDEFATILETWFRRGLDGFRIDVAHGLHVDRDLRDNPVPAGVELDALGGIDAFRAMEHVHDQDQPEVVEVYRDWHRLAARHDALLLGEVNLPDPERVARYVQDGALHRAFCFPTLRTGWDAGAIRDVLETGVACGGGRFAWPMSSHDDPRAATRFGGGAAGTERQLAFLALLLALPGMPFLFQGDELGLEDGHLDPDQVADPIATRNVGTAGRDGARTPMPWTDAPGWGFTTGTPWLPFGSNRRPQDTVQQQTGDSRSPLERTRALLQARRSLTSMLATDEVTWLDTPAHVIALRRGDVVAAMNVAGADTALDLPAPGTLVAASAAGASIHDRTLHLPTDTTALVRLDQPSA